MGWLLLVLRRIAFGRMQHRVFGPARPTRLEACWGHPHGCRSHPLSIRHHSPRKQAEARYFFLTELDISGIIEAAIPKGCAQYPSQLRYVLPTIWIPPRTPAGLRLNRRYVIYWYPFPCPVHAREMTMLWEVEIKPKGNDPERARVREEYALLTHGKDLTGLVTGAARGYL